MKVTQQQIDQVASRLKPIIVDILLRRHGLKPYNKVQTLQDIGNALGLTRDEVLKFSRKGLRIIENIKLNDL